jgi:alpha-L-fucosidase
LPLAALIVPATFHHSQRTFCPYEGFTLNESNSPLASLRIYFKDTIPLQKAERFAADYLPSLYKKAGTKYFITMGVHHDNFNL